VKVTPLDIRRKEFKRSMRGYSDEEVDLFLDEVADEFERLFQENIELQERVQRLEEQMAAHAQLREALEKTLITAQIQADEIRANARKESELILRDAELKARDIIGESYKETQRVQQTLIQLKRLEEDFRFKFRSLLEGHLKLLDEAPIGVPSREGVGRVTVTPPGAASTQVEEAIPAQTEAATSAGAAREQEAVATTSRPEEPPSDEPAAWRRSADRQESPGDEVGSEETTVEEVPVTGEQPQTEGAREESGVMFGRGLSDLEVGFFAPQTTRDKDRDFEW